MDITVILAIALAANMALTAYIVKRLHELAKQANAWRCAFGLRSAIIERRPAVTYGDGVYVAIAPEGDGFRVISSPDYINWTERTTPLAPTKASEGVET